MNKKNKDAYDRIEVTRDTAPEFREKIDRLSRYCDELVQEVLDVGASHLMIKSGDFKGMGIPCCVLIVANPELRDKLFTFIADFEKGTPDGC